MPQDLDVEQVAGALYVSIGLLRRRLQKSQAEGELTLPDTAALSRLHRAGPTTSAALARLEQITPQSMGRRSAPWRRGAWWREGQTPTTGGG